MAEWFFDGYLDSRYIKRSRKVHHTGEPVEQGAPGGADGGIEAVVEKGRTTGNVITPIKK